MTTRAARAAERDRCLVERSGRGRQSPRHAREDDRCPDRGRDDEARADQRERDREAEIARPRAQDRGDDEAAEADREDPGDDQRPRPEPGQQDAGDRAGGRQRDHERDRRDHGQDRPVGENELEVERDLEERRGLGVGDDEPDEQGDRDRTTLDLEGVRPARRRRRSTDRPAATRKALR